MIELGHISLISAFVVSIMQVVCGIVGVRTKDKVYTICALILNATVFVLLSVSFFILVNSFINSDFSVKIVFENSHYLMPILYKFFAVWGNHEGSMFLWIWVLSFSGFLLGISVYRQQKISQFIGYVYSVQGVVCSLFLLFVLFTSNPFERLFPVPIQGRDLNPILQDIGLVLHPPFLYLGYVGISVVYVLVVAGLLSGIDGKKLNALLRPWVLIAWSFLGAGIGLGAWWAYYELGWGGFWFWDPVENISLMPWLMTTALLHVLVLQNNSDSHQRWIIILSIASFGFSLLGTFLVRSGILSSVHTFATDPLRGLYLLSIFAILMGGAYYIYAIKYDALSNEKGGGESKVPNFLLSTQIVLVITCACVVLIGTLYPVILESLTNKKISVGAGYFDTTFIPLSVLVLVMLGIASMSSIKRNLICVASISIFMWWLLDVRSFFGAGGIIVAMWVCITTIMEAKNKWQQKSFWAMGSILSHLGVGVIALGITGATMLSQEYVQSLNIGSSKKVGDMTVSMQNIKTVQQDNYVAFRAKIVIQEGGRIYTLYPEKRRYLNRGIVTVETDIHSTLLYDYAVALGNNTANTITVRIYKKAMISWIWLGVFFMFFGGMISSIYRFKRGM